MILEKRNKTRRWYLINIIIIFSLVFFTGIFIYVVSCKNLQVMVNAGYPGLFITAAILLLILIVFNLLTAFLYGEKKGNLLQKTIKTATLLQLTTIIIAGILLPRYYFHLLYGKKPDIADNYRDRIGPFIQPGPVDRNKILPLSDSLVIWWFDPLKEKKTASLIYGKSPDKRKMKTADEVKSGDGKKHLVLLKNLTPSTRYFYLIPGFDNEIHSFKTGPGRGKNSPFSFLCTGDAANKGGNTVSFSEIINRSADSFYGKAGKRPAFKLVLGDIAHNGRDMESWRRYFSGETLHSRVYPVLTVLGNHEFLDDFGGNHDYFIEHPRYYTFDYSGAHFLVIHNYDGFLRTVGRDQYRFIEKDLRENFNKKWIIVALHEPLLSTGDYNYNELLISQLFEMFRKYRVDLVLAGHDHHYDSFWVDRESNWGGTIYIVNGGGGSRIDDYIMRRKKIRWKTWYHDRNSSRGLYSDDVFTTRFHIYGEISWGFMDIEITKNRLNTTYYRWMNIEEYRKASEQEEGNWEMIPLEITDAKPVHTLRKKRRFKP